VFGGGREEPMESGLAQFFVSLTTGIYVLTVADGGRHHGMSSSWVTQVSGEPPLFMAAVDVAHFSGQVVARTGTFGLNIVGHRSRHLEDYFLSSAARRPDNLDRVAYELSPGLGVPWLTEAAASVEARVVDSIAAGDHRMLIAQPAGVRINYPDRPLTSLDLDYVYLGGRTVIARDRSGWPQPEGG
jgi:flavin reductase (DIM6/NTAB) family NADH-FMN oxidoreductase RutF